MTAQNPLVTICLPVFNTEAYLDEAIQSALAQDFSNWTMLISDNASTDRSVEIAKSYSDPRIHIYQQDHNKGVSGNWQFLFEQVTTPYFCILGADDILLPNHLSRKLGYLERDPDAPYVHGASHLIDSNGASLPSPDIGCAEVEKRTVTLPRLLKENFVNPTSTLFRTEALRRFHLGFEKRYPIIMDWALSLKISMRYDHILYDKEATSKYRVHPTSVARTAAKSFQWVHETSSVLLDALREYPEIWREIGINPEQKAREISLPLWTVFVQQKRLGHRENAEIIWKLFRSYHSPWDIPLDFPRYAAELWRKMRKR